MRRNVRERSAPHEPRELPLLAPEDRQLLRAWVSADSSSRRWQVLLKMADRADIERAEALAERLLAHGWLVLHERLQGGSWLQERVTWRDLDGLKALVGVGSRKTRSDERELLLAEARAWLQQRDAAPGSELQGEMEAALAQLAGDGTAQLDLLRTRLGLLRALAAWDEGAMEGVRRNFALHASDRTKAIGAADWRWLEAGFDLERLRIAQFAPMLWLAGSIGLQWGARRVDVAGLHCIAVPLGDLRRLDRVDGVPQRYWLIENRASFERQAQQLPAGCCLLWLPGRPTRAWLAAVRTLLRLAPAPAWISADADPSGVEIALGAGRLWDDGGVPWEPHRMGAADLLASGQVWPLNDHDRGALARLLAQPGLRGELRSLCEAMQQHGRKAEQEGWL